MSQLATILSIIGAAVGVVIALGGIAVYLGRRADTGTIESLDDTIASQERQIKTFRDELGQVRGALTTANTHITDLENRVNVLEEENATLLAIRPSAEAIIAIDHKIDAYHRETLERHEAMVASLEAMKRSLDATRP